MKKDKNHEAIMAYFHRRWAYFAGRNLHPKCGFNRYVQRNMPAVRANIEDNPEYLNWYPNEFKGE